MPHECTNCGRTFADGSKEMLSGCPDCSGTKFQFRPEGFADDRGSPDDSSGRAGEDAVDRPGTATTDSGADPVDSGTRSEAVSRTVGSAAATVRDLVGGSAGPDATAARPPEGDGTTDDAGDDIIVAEPDPGIEDAAQADARSGLATADELPGDPASDEVGDAPPGSSSDGDLASDGTTDDRTEVSEPDVETADRPDISQLREELNEQFESIRVVEPGQYELNLMELYDREEYIIALQEDGRYSIQVPETWRDGED
ncbi:MAG: Zn-ribbon containing protein [Haloarculaceae archaeon]